MSRDRPPWTYHADGLATIHRSPFLYNREWALRYDEMAADWYEHRIIDARWRMWVLTSIAQSVERPEASFAEFGVYRAGCAFMILATTKNARMFLFDTFAGPPIAHLTRTEGNAWFSRHLSNTSPELVRERLAGFEDRVNLVVGDVFDTLEAAETGPLSLLHVDLNAAAPTMRALDYAYERLVTGGVMVFDDYGYEESYIEQREVIDEFFTNRLEFPVALPTGQAIAIKR